MTTPRPDDDVDPAHIDPTGGVEVWAAGGVVRRAAADGLEILLIHRPDRRDWSLPKGKVDPGETLREAARREIREETGFDCELDERIATVRYRDARRRSKAVVYFSATVSNGDFSPNDEVDEIAWCSPTDAASRLTYEQDARLVEGLAGLDSERFETG